jgi:hypothetical protein
MPPWWFILLAVPAAVVTLLPLLALILNARDRRRHAR